MTTIKELRIIKVYYSQVLHTTQHAGGHTVRSQVERERVNLCSASLFGVEGGGLGFHRFTLYVKFKKIRENKGVRSLKLSVIQVTQGFLKGKFHRWGWPHFILTYLASSSVIQLTISLFYLR